MTFISLPLKFISEYSSEFRYGFSQNNFMYEKENKLSQPALISIKISTWLSRVVYCNNINEKCAIFLQNTHFCVLQNIDFIYLLRQYQTLPLRSRVCPANSTACILFFKVKVCKYY